MKALVFHGIGDIRLDTVPDPGIEQPTDAIVRITSSAICGTDLHMIRGTFPGMVPGTVLGHEAVGIVEEVGSNVRNLSRGDRVVVPSTIACGYCSYCRAGYFAQCDNANPNGPAAGTAFFGGPKATGPFNGLQAEYARIPFANVGLVKLPEAVADDEAIMISDIFPTGYFGAELAEIEDGDTVAIFGCGPVGQFAITSAFMRGAGRVLAIDTVPTRLEMARAQGSEVIDFNAEDPIQVIKDLTGGIGVDRVIDAVGVDAERPHSGPAARQAAQKAEQFDREVAQIAPNANPDGQLWQPGDAPSQVLTWAVESIAKAGTLGIIGVYPPSMQHFPIGQAMNKNLTLKMGNCNHRRYIPMLVDLVEAGAVTPTKILTQREPLTDVIAAYKAFDTRQPGWVKVELVPAA
jgi:threonine dehydrogenase-like Zn-dependent dehydrogenase